MTRVAPAFTARLIYKNRKIILKNLSSSWRWRRVSKGNSEHSFRSLPSEVRFVYEMLEVYWFEVNCLVICKAHVHGWTHYV